MISTTGWRNQRIAAGCTEVRPVAELDEARALADGMRAGRVLLAGERDGAAVPGFDLGNSPAALTKPLCRDATLEQIRDAYRAKAKRYHPDAGGEAWAIRILVQAYEVMSTARVTRATEREFLRPAPTPPPPPPTSEPPPRSRPAPEEWSNETVRPGVQDAAADIGTNWLPTTQHALGVSNSLAQFRMAEGMHVLSKTSADREGYEAEIQIHVEELEKGVKSLRGVIRSKEDSAAFAEFADAWAAYKAAHDTVVALSKAEKSDSALAMVQNQTQELFDKVLLIGLHGQFAFAAPPLALIETDRLTLDIPAMAFRHHHIFFGNQILNIDLFFGLDDLRAPRIAVLFF